MDFDDQSMISLKFLDTPNNPLNRSIVSPSRLTPQKTDENDRIYPYSPDGTHGRNPLVQVDMNKIQTRKNSNNTKRLLGTDTIEELTAENDKS